MKLSAVAAVFFAGLAAAHSGHHYPQHRFQHRRGLNGTTSAPAALTTMTVQLTQTHTIFSCAQNVTNCPAASATGSHVVTEVVDLTVTVCPQTEADAIKSSVLASASQGQNAAVPTNVAAVTTPAAVPTSSEGGDKVLTYTLGNGPSRTVITTTIQATKTKTTYATKTIIWDGTTDDNSGNEGPELTTTIRTTSTQYRTVTVQPPKPSKSVVQANNNAVVPGSTPSGGAAGDCPPAVTVTVAEKTVTVTYTPPAATAVAPVPTQAAVVDTNNNAPVDTGAEQEGEGEDEDDDEDVVIVVETRPVIPMETLPPAPAPSSSATSSTAAAPKPTKSAHPQGPVYGNGTHPAATTKCASTLVKMARPTGSPIAPHPLKY